MSKTYEENTFMKFLMKKHTFINCYFLISQNNQKNIFVSLPIIKCTTSLYILL